MKIWLLEQTGTVDKIINVWYKRADKPLYTSIRGKHCFKIRYSIILRKEFIR